METQERKETSKNERDKLADKTDLVLDAPELKLEGVHLDIQNVESKISLNVNIGNLVNLEVGVDLEADTLKLELDNLEAEAYLRVSLDRIEHIINRTLETIDNNPDILKSLGNGDEIAKEESDSSEKTPDTSDISSSKNEREEDETDQDKNRDEVIRTLKESALKTEKMAQKLSRKADEMLNEA